MAYGPAVSVGRQYFDDELGRAMARATQFRAPTGRADPAETLRFNARPAQGSITARETPVNPLDRAAESITASGWYRGLSPEGQRTVGGLIGGADLLASPARGAYELGAGAASSDYGRAALGALDVIPEGGKGASLAVGAVLPKLRRAASDVPINQAAALTDNRIAQRVPFAKGTPEDIGSTRDLRINMDAMRADPEYFDKVTGAQPILDASGNRVPVLAKGKPTGEFKEEPLHSIIPEKVAGSRDPEERAGAARTLIMSNLDRLYRGMDEGTRNRATLWYPGGNRIAGDIAKTAGVERESAAGAVAALSPQTDWFQNVAMAQRVAETMGENPRITADMIRALRERGPPELSKGSKDLEQHIGARWSELPDREAGIAAVAHDMQTRSGGYHMLKPEGQQMGYQLTGAEQPQKLGWQNFTNLEKAVMALRSGGDMQKISDAAGEAHKVRNFYNNLISPDPRWDDYTSDTHNVAASLLSPLAGANQRVGVGLGIAGPKSSVTGAKGLYGLYADSARDLAKQYGGGLAPFQVQSPTWEGVRALFPKDAKTKANKKVVDSIWADYRKGDLTLEQAQDKVFSFAQEKMGGDINRVPWRQ